MILTSLHVTRRRQAGQALVEALLLLPLMGLLVWAVSWVGGLQFSAQQMSQLSRKAAMAGALGKPLGQPLGQPLVPQESRNGARLTQRTYALTGVVAPRLAALQQEWFGHGLQLLSVHARAPSWRGQAAGVLPITRHTHVAVGAGHAYGDTDATRRIDHAPTPWRRAERDSLTAAQRVDALARRMDGPWGRPSLQTDWLSPWADVVPTERLVKRKGKRP